MPNTPLQSAVTKRQPVMRPSTRGERVYDMFHDLYTSAAEQPIIALLDKLGLTDIKGVAGEFSDPEAATRTKMGTNMGAILPMGKMGGLANATQDFLPFGRTPKQLEKFAKDLRSWKDGPPLGGADFTPASAAPVADEALPVQGVLDFGTDVVKGGANKVQQLVQQMKQLDLPFGDGVPVRGVPDKLGPGFTVPKQSPAGKSPFPDLAPTQQKLPMEIPSTRMGPPITSKATATPPATPAAQASAGRLGKVGGAMARHPFRTAAGVGAAGLLGYNMLNGGGGETPEEAPVATGGGGGRGVAAPQQGVDWSQLETLLNPSPTQAPQQAAPMSLTDALMPMQKQSKGFDWSQLTQMLPALLVAIAMMKRR